MINIIFKPILTRNDIKDTSSVTFSNTMPVHLLFVLNKMLDFFL